ncbi:MAG TPA: hypothetical protein VK712_00235 [Verrucomicrobiae bacterium]|jgi:hypothetical protein|nr:hypothetical protein [Verrucomicrobiae bacterium]
MGTVSLSTPSVSIKGGYTVVLDRRLKAANSSGDRDQLENYDLYIKVDDERFAEYAVIEPLYDDQQSITYTDEALAGNDLAAADEQVLAILHEVTEAMEQQYP